MYATLLKTMRDNGMLPKISATERQALEAGTVWIDGEFFRGNPDFKRMLSAGYHRLSAAEQEFLDGPTEELCRMIDSYEIAETRRIPDAVIRYIHDQGFMGLLIPTEFGGKGFSVLARSSVMAKIAPHSPIVGTYITIPNSLGAAELLTVYGTEAQKTHYLPRLASGEYVPCFGLTEPTAGSDAASIKAEGLVFRDTDGELKARLNFRKRYITLAPVANLISTACVLRDPENLLGQGENIGITVIMLEKGMDGLEIGDHHEPIGEAFANGPIIGRDVIAPIENIIGGPAFAGQGWRMLMESLAGGRVVSLPAGGIGGAKAMAALTGPYSMVRQQFGIPIGHMEGVQDKVGRLAAFAYMLEGARVYTCSAVDDGEHPPVVSAIMKQKSTELSRELGIDAMDVFAGAGVMQGPNNVVGRGYCTAPVPITVEGANIMTRTLIIFGQGATRCHPYAQQIVDAVGEEDVAAFRTGLLGWMRHFAANCGRTLVRGLTRGWSAGSPVSGPTARYYRRLGWAASRFAVLADLAMFLVGSRLKARGNLTGRYADVLTWMILGISTLRRYESEGRRAEDLPLVQYALDTALSEIQLAFEGIYSNFKAPIVGHWLSTVGLLWLRINPLGRRPNDSLIARCARTIQQPGEQFDRITDGVYKAAADKPAAGRLLEAFRVVSVARPAANKVLKAQKAGQLPRGKLPGELADQALAAGLVDATEAKQLKAALAARMAAIEVDVFAPEQFYRDRMDTPANAPVAELKAAANA